MSLSFLALQFASLPVWAAPKPEVEGRVYHNSCSYYSSTTAELNVRYRGELEPGTRVFLKYGIIGFRPGYDASHHWTEIPFAWEDIKEEEMTLTQQGVRSLWLRLNLHERSSSRYINKLGFVFHVVLPNGEFYDNGFTSPWGSYEVAFNTDNIRCWDSNGSVGVEGPPFLPLPITIQNKN
jgi:hypothetical protein